MTKRINVRQLTPATGRPPATGHKGPSARGAGRGDRLGGTHDHLRKHR
jgi:hypothetical protein